MFSRYIPIETVKSTLKITNPHHFFGNKPYEDGGANCPNKGNGKFIYYAIFNVITNTSIIMIMAIIYNNMICEHIEVIHRTIEKSIL